MALAVPALDVQTEVRVVPLPLVRARAREAEVLRRLGAYVRGRNDREAGEILGIAKSAFQAWRIRAVLPAKGERTRVRSKIASPRPSAELDAIRREAFAAARSDREAADALGITVQSFHHWRTSRGIPAKNRPGEHVPGSAPSMFCPVDGSLLLVGRCHGCEAARDRAEREVRVRRGGP